MGNHFWFCEKVNIFSEVLNLRIGGQKLYKDSEDVEILYLQFTMLCVCVFVLLYSQVNCVLNKMLNRKMSMKEKKNKNKLKCLIPYQTISYFLCNRRFVFNFTPKMEQNRKRATFNWNISYVLHWNHFLMLFSYIIGSNNIKYRKFLCTPNKFHPNLPLYTSLYLSISSI